jgi:hypothetical protein
MTSETVATETPVARATSCAVTLVFRIGRQPSVALVAR